MIDYIKKLEETLHKILDLHESLISAARSMNTSIKENKVEKVKEASAQYDELTFQVEQLEEVRLAVSDAIARELKYPQRHISLESIISSLGKQKGAALSELRTQLKGKMNELARLNTSNRVLLEESLLTISRTMDLLAQTSNYLTGYQQHGGKNIERVAKNLINKIA